MELAPLAVSAGAQRAEDRSFDQEAFSWQTKDCKLPCYIKDVEQFLFRLTLTQVARPLR